MIAKRLATALLAVICLLKMAFLFTSSTVIFLASLSTLYSAWALEITVGTTFGVWGAPDGDDGTGNDPLSGTT